MLVTGRVPVKNGRESKIREQMKSLELSAPLSRSYLTVVCLGGHPASQKCKIIMLNGRDRPLVLLNGSVCSWHDRPSQLEKCKIIC